MFRQHHNFPFRLPCTLPFLYSDRQWASSTFCSRSLELPSPWQLWQRSFLKHKRQEPTGSSRRSISPWPRNRGLLFWEPSIKVSLSTTIQAANRWRASSSGRTNTILFPVRRDPCPIFPSRRRREISRFPQALSSGAISTRDAKTQTTAQEKRS